MQEYEYNKMAMGTEVSIAVVTTSREDADLGGAEALSLIEKYEERFSRFLPNSELTQLNTTGKMQVSTEFLEVLQEAISLSKKTQAIFNPLMQISRLGYNKSFSTIGAHSQENTNTLYDIDTAKIGIDHDTHTVTLAPGQKLDFGGFLKGYLAERIAKNLMHTFSSYQGVIVNLGGDLHARGTDEYGKHFIFEIYNPITKQGEHFTIHNKSLATSGSYKRAWQTSKGTRHHILDRSGKENSTTDIVSASVIHADGAKSEAYAKVLMTLPIHEALPIINDPDIIYLLITNTGATLTN